MIVKILFDASENLRSRCKLLAGATNITPISAPPRMLFLYLEEQPLEQLRERILELPGVRGVSRLNIPASLNDIYSEKLQQLLMQYI